MADFSIFTRAVALSLDKKSKKGYSILNTCENIREANVKNTAWMGRYRHLIETIVRHRNAFSRVMNNKTEHYNDVSLSIIEWEVLEYIIEHEDDDSSMAQLSERLMIPASSFSKISQALCGYGLIAKYQMVGNKKNIILKPTDLGLKYYRDRSSLLIELIFGDFFKELEGFSDDELEHIANAIEILTPLPDDSLPQENAEGRRLIPMKNP